MRWSHRVCALVAVGLLAGCVRAAPVPAPVAAPVPVGPDFAQVASPGALSITDLEAGLRRLVNTPPMEQAPQRLAMLLRRWKLPAPYETDLNDDGSPELVLALTGEGGTAGVGDLFIIYRWGGSYAVERTGQPELFRVAVFNVTDLNLDGRPEVVWSSENPGAHTPTLQVFATNWKPGSFTNLPGTPVSMQSARILQANSDLLLHGGMINSVGAGLAQRPRTDHYRWVSGAIRLVDRQFMASTYAYHRLQDGLVAEEFRREGDALQALEDAMQPGRPAVRPEALDHPEDLKRFGEAVRTFARLRLALLLNSMANPAEARRVVEEARGDSAALVQILLGKGGPDAWCRQAEAWAQANPGFLEALNLPVGYANPKWTPQTLCGSLPL